MKRTTVTSMVAFALAAAPAFAGNMEAPATPMVEAPAAPAFNWTGAYAGFSVSGGHSTHGNANPGFDLPNGSGAGFGGLVGYNWQRNNTVFGAELHVDASSIDGTAPCANPTFTCDSEVKGLASLRGRVGYAQDRNLFFVSLGAAAGRVKQMTTDGAGVQYPDTRTLNGGMISLGYERALNNGWTVRAEIEHYDFGKEDFNLDVLYPDVDVDANVFRIGFVRRF